MRPLVGIYMYCTKRFAILLMRYFDYIFFKQYIFQYIKICYVLQFRIIIKFLQLEVLKMSFKLAKQQLVITKSVR